jgi:hypothetical protein
MYLSRFGLTAAAFAFAILSLPSAPLGAASSKLKSTPQQSQQAVRVIVDTTPWPKSAGPNGTVCFSDHFHYGSSRDQANRETALHIASTAWSEFVVFEYGDLYADLTLAQSRTDSCSRTAGGWSCVVQARPCRRAG